MCYSVFFSFFFLSLFLKYKNSIDTDRRVSFVLTKQYKTLASYVQEQLGQSCNLNSKSLRGLWEIVTNTEEEMVYVRRQDSKHTGGHYVWRSELSPSPCPLVIPRPTGSATSRGLFARCQVPAQPQINSTRAFAQHPFPSTLPYPLLPFACHNSCSFGG